MGKGKRKDKMFGRKKMNKKTGIYKKESATQERDNLLSEDPVADRERDTILMKTKEERAAAKARRKMRRGKGEGQSETYNKKGGLMKTNSWEEHDVKEGKKQMREGHKGHAEALFDDAHGSWNWSKSHHSTGAEHHHVVNRIAGRNSR